MASNEKVCVDCLSRGKARPAKRNGRCWGHDRALYRRLEGPIAKRDGYATPSERLVAAVLKVREAPKQDRRAADQRVRMAAVNFARRYRWERLVLAAEALDDADPLDDEAFAAAEKELYKAALDYGFIAFPVPRVTANGPLSPDETTPKRGVGLGRSRGQS